jgi:catalase
MTRDARERLVGNIVASMGSVPREIQERQIRHFHKADPNWGRSVAEGLGLRTEEVLNGELATTGD